MQYSQSYAVFFSCLFETPPIPRLLYFENEREYKVACLSTACLGSFKFEIWRRLRVRVTKTNSAKNKNRRKNFSDDLLLEPISQFQFLREMPPFVRACHMYGCMISAQAKPISDITILS